MVQDIDILTMED